MLCGLISASLLFASCLGNDDDTETANYADMAITQFTLSALNRYTASTSTTTGNDTILKTAVTASNYYMAIDQLNLRIYNQELLPVGTDLKHVLVSITTKNSGVVAIKSLTSDSLRWYSSTDSIDFTQPRTFRVFAINGKGSRDYVVTLTASETTGTTFEWQRKAQRPDLQGWTSDRLVAFADSVALVSEGTLVKGTTAYRINGGMLEQSADLLSWQSVGSATNLLQLVAQGTKELFALTTDGKMVHTYNDGLTWEEETLDADPSLLPVESLASATWNYKPVDHTDYVLLCGHHPTDINAAVVWRKLSCYEGSDKGGRWIYMPYDDANRSTLPRQQNLSLVYYDNRVLALGSNMTMLESTDEGITWKTATDYQLPSALQGNIATMAADTQGRLWMLTDSGDLWVGALRQKKYGER